MIFIIDTFLLVGIIIFLIAAGKLVLDNIVSILLVLVLIAVFIFLMSKWPGKTLIGVLILGLIALIIVGIDFAAQENSIEVTIYEAVGECRVYDKNENIVTIPKGAILARYQDERERQPEGTNYFGFVNVCSYHYNGCTQQFYVSNSHDTSFTGLPRSKWNLKELDTITYGEYKKGKWMNIE